MHIQANNIKGCWQHQQLGRGKEAFSLRSRGSMALLGPYLQSSGVSNYDKIQFCSLKMLGFRIICHARLNELICQVLLVLLVWGQQLALKQRARRLNTFLKEKSGRDHVVNILFQEKEVLTVFFFPLGFYAFILWLAQSNPYHF